EEEIQRSYLDYAMSVIVGRALPDVRDGLKPVHRRILWAMFEQGLRPDRPYRKSANVVGGVMSKYHPHGDTAIYDALVRMAQDIKDAYATGRGSIKVRAVATIEEGSGGRSNIVVTELPYQVNKARLAEKIAELVKGGRVKDVADVQDHSSGRNGMRLVIVLKRGANPHVVLNQLYKHTQLQDSFGVIMLALVDGVPRTLNLAEMIGYYVDHQVDVVTRRTRFEKRKREERLHIVDGLLIALDHLDEVIKIIRGSQDAEEARTKLMSTFKLS